MNELEIAVEEWSKGVAPAVNKYLLEKENKTPNMVCTYCGSPFYREGPNPLWNEMGYPLCAWCSTP